MIGDGAAFVSGNSKSVVTAHRGTVMPGLSPSKTGVNALMSRASTSFFRSSRDKHGVDGRDKPGHDGGKRISVRECHDIGVGRIARQNTAFAREVIHAGHEHL